MIETAESEHDNGKNNADRCAQTFFRGVTYRFHGKRDEHTAQNRGTERSYRPLLRGKLTGNDRFALRDDTFGNGRIIRQERDNRYAEDITKETDG